MITPAQASDVLEEYQALLNKTPKKYWSVKVGPKAWTLGEITGHLVDSAVNNHQRFVRLQFGNLLMFPGYEAEAWVAAQKYAEMDKDTLSSLWEGMNKLLFHVAFSSPAIALENHWKNERGEESLSFLISDYYEHMKIHIEHYRARLKEIQAV